jgi:hypothetical protein
MTHEEFVGAIADIAASKLSSTDAAIVRDVKLCYGAGPDGTRGVTYYNRWKNGGTEAVPFVAINALHQESNVQLAGTTLHELGHVLAGWKAGHGADWHTACDKLGLRCVRAAGTAYTWAHFAPDIREAIIRLPTPKDGTPLDLSKLMPGNALLTGQRPGLLKLKPCSAGVGTRGGKSQGKGSGSRLRLFECDCVPPVKVRVARDNFEAACLCCDGLFHLK